MKISVLMSVYYKEKSEYLDQALESIVNQTFKPAQIVIVKDGKIPEELEDILQKYKKEHHQIIDIYSLPYNIGLGEALKYGVDKCKFEYIARMDTDDISPLYRLEEQAKILQNNPDIDILGGYIEEYDEKMNKIISIRKVPLTKEEISTYIKFQSPFNHGTVIIKKEAIIKAGNYDNTQLEDYDLWARMLINKCEMMNINMILGKNRTGNSMYKRRSGLKQIKKVIEIEKKLLRYRIINKFTFLKNIVSRSIVAILPIKLKNIVYTNIIRKLKTN